MSIYGRKTPKNDVAYDEKKETHWKECKKCVVYEWIDEDKLYNVESKDLNTTWERIVGMQVKSWKRGKRSGIWRRQAH